MLKPRDAIALLPDLQASAFQIEPMSGGLTNRVYKLSSDDTTYVMRLDAAHTEAFGLDRCSEITLLAHASSAGIAPEVVYSDVDEGILLLRFVDGRVWDAGDLSVPKNIELLADLLRHVHALPSSENVFDAAATAARYSQNLCSHPELSEFGQHCYTIIEKIGSAENNCCCHNDVVAANVIECPNLMLLDWEYACDNEPLFDLASVIAYHTLDSTISEVLLSEYAGGSTPELRERLATQVRLYDALHWLWLASRQVLSPSPSQESRLSELGRSIR